MNTLETRERTFGELTSRFDCTRPTPLIAVYKIPENLFLRLQTKVIDYMVSCLPDRNPIRTEEGILAEFERLRGDEVRRGKANDRDLIKNATPNGLLVPKRHNWMEYNGVVGVYAELMASLNISDLIHSFHIPLNIRYKDLAGAPENIGRGRATELTHTDSWAGESPASATTMLPLLGDEKNNTVLFKAPPKDFNEDWIKYLPSYENGQKLIKDFYAVDVPYEKGLLLIADFATVHTSSRLAQATGPRVSIDTTFALNRNRDNIPGIEDKMHSWRKEERASPEELYAIPSERVFYFPDTNDDQVESKGAKHPSNLINLGLPKK